MNPKLIVGTALAFLGLVLVLVLNPFTVVPSGYKGLVFNWGALSEQTLDQGLHFRIPIMQSIKTITTQPIQLDYEVAVGTDGAITQDNQTLGAHTTVFYQFDPNKVVSIYRDYGLANIESIVRSDLKESFKEIIGKHTIFDVASQQEDIRLKVTEDVRAKLEKYPVTITELRISNYDWSDQFDQQIQATMVRAQQVKQAEQELLITQQQAQKQVKEAEAAKQAQVTRAEGDRDAAKLQAEAKALEGDGIKKYNDAIAQNINIELKLRELEIEKERVEKWNGEYVPNNNYLPIPYNYGAVQGK